MNRSISFVFVLYVIFPACVLSTILKATDHDTGKTNTMDKFIFLDKLILNVINILNKTLDPIEVVEEENIEFTNSSYLNKTSASNSTKRCDCGENSKSCKYVKGKKKCDCEKGYTEFKEQCLLKECDCGQNTKFCKLDDYYKKKICYCDDGYSEKTNHYSFDDVQCKKCDCGIGALSCKFDIHGNRKCDCRSGYSKQGTLSDEICSKCDCGEYATSCYFKYIGTKVCTCKEDAIIAYDKLGEETCKLICDCGPNAISCTLENNYKICECAVGYESRAELADDHCYKKTGTITAWRIGTYVLLMLFGAVIIFQVTLLCQKINERRMTRQI